MDDGPESIPERGRLTCHCLLVETSAGLVLCDTGFDRGAGWLLQAGDA